MKNRKTDYQTIIFSLLLAAAWSMPLSAQSVTTPPGAAAEEEDDIVELSPFEVTADEAEGYNAATTLAGNRLNTRLRDLGNAVSVVTSQFLQDTGATNNETLLQYTTSSEVGNVHGNFAGHGDGATPDETDSFRNPNQNTRIRGLTSADNTREYFLTDIPWDGYNVDRVDLQRGPNSILFGQGSPAGIINTSTMSANFSNSGELEVRLDDNGTVRGSFNFNRVVIEDQLAIRVAALRDHEKFKQKPAFDDDERFYAALRWEPEFLRGGGSRTILKASFEKGSIDSNRPRVLPPIDRITPWFLAGTYQGRFADGTPRTFNHLNKETFNPFQLQDDNTGRPNHGQMRPSINGGPNAGQPNPAYQPLIGNFGQQFGGPLAFFNADGTSANAYPAYTIAELGSRFTKNGIGADGTIDGNIGVSFHRPGGIDTQSNFARKAGLPFGEFGVYKDNSITDPTIFDFYHNLIDGPNKREWQDFDTVNVGLTQTFFDDKVGIEAVYYEESYQNGRTGVLSGDKIAIGIDLNNVYSDGTDPGLNGEPFQDGTPNPNVGRPFISDSSQFSNNSTENDRESSRVTGFVTHDFDRDGSSWVTRLLGEHTLTGLYQRDILDRDQRNWQRYGLGQAYSNVIRLPTESQLRFNINELTPNTYIYLGPSLADRSSASGAHIPRPTGMSTVTSGMVRIFDSTWNRPTNPADPGYVDPAAEWIRNYYPDEAPFNDPDAEGGGQRFSTQSENPANYVGWTSIPVNVLDAESSEATRDMLTTSAELSRSRVSSQAFVWQGHFWDNSIVGTWGVRKDIAKSWSHRQTSKDTDDGRLDFSPDAYQLPDDPVNRLDVTSHSWMVVAHLNDLPGLSKAMEKLPVNVSLFYNESSDFQPAAQRVNLYGEPISAPAGETTDQGVLFETKDGRFTFRINRYETTSTNASSSALDGAWFIGSSQAWAGNWANRFEFNWGGDTIASAVDPSIAEDSSHGDFTKYNYGTAPGETQAEANAREQAAIAAWRTWQASVDPRFYEAWGIDLDAPFGANPSSLSASTPTGFAITEDSISKGYEIEFSALPARNWRLTVNASKTDAKRTNVGGTELGEFVAAYQDALRNTAAGDLRIWWGGSGNETTLFQWNNNIGSEFTQRTLQNNTNVPELRKWRVNAISTYDITDGRFNGVTIGGAMRYESNIVIGYQPVLDPSDPTSVSFDIDNPYRGPSEMNFDFWLGYGRRIYGDRVDWRIQLNVRNFLNDDDLIPITTQPDGTPALYRIQPPQTVTLTNTLRF